MIGSNVVLLRSCRCREITTDGHACNSCRAHIKEFAPKNQVKYFVDHIKKTKLIH